MRLSLPAQANPSDKKYARKNLVQTTQYEKTTSNETFSTNRAKDKPMTRQAFHKYCDGTLGITEQEEEEWWTELDDNPRVDRDFLGFRGRKQLWTPVGAEREWGSRKGQGHQLKEKGQEVKNMSGEETASLKEFVREATISGADSFFHTNLEVQQALKRKNLMEATSSSADGSGADSGAGPSSSKKLKSTKVYVPERDAPKLHTSMAAELGKLDALYATDNIKVQQVIEQLKQISEADKNDDKSLVSYIRSLQFRWQLAIKWKGLNQPIKLFGISDGPSAASTTPPSTGGSSTPGGERAAPLGDTEMTSISLKDLAEREKARKPFAGEAKDIKTLTEMHTICDEELFECNTPDELTELVASWDVCLAIANDVLCAVRDTCGYIESHLGAKKKRAQKAEREAEKKKQQDAIAKVKQDAKEAAERIKAANKPAIKAPATIAPIFLAVWDEIDDADEVKEIPSKEADAWDLPFTVPEHTDITLLMGNQNLQKELAGWAVEFRGKQDSRSQKPLQGSGKETGSGLTEATELFQKWQPPSVDIKSVDGGSAFMNTIWKCGYKEQMEFTGFAPNCAAILRVLATGRVRCLFIKTDSLFQALAKEGCPEGLKMLAAESRSATIEKIPKMDAAALKAAKEGGLIMKKVVQTSSSMVYVPMGWLIVETCGQGDSLNYGIRKSFITSSTASKAIYSFVGELFKEAGKDVVRMDAIKALI
eukprot:4199867-Pyramimonas_sp.AAC.1